MYATTGIEWTYIDINESNITKDILVATELSIPKSPEKPHQQHNTGRTTWELGWQTIDRYNCKLKDTDNIHRRPV